MSNTKEMKEKFINEFISLLENENMFLWEKGWVLKLNRNKFSQTEYRGYNQLILMWIASKNVDYSNEWLTFNQAKEMKFSIKKESKGVTIKYCCYYDLLNKKFLTFQKYIDELNNGRNKNEFKIKPKFYTLFNTSQLNEYEQVKTIRCENDISHIDKYLEKNNIITKFSDYFSPSYCDHQIFMPNHSLFKNSDEYFSTLFHELGHAVIDNIKLQYDKELSADEKYAYEEMVVEIGSVLLCCEFQIEYKSIENNKAYVKSWLQKLKDNENYLMNAIKEANRIVNTVMKGNDF